MSVTYHMGTIWDRIVLRVTRAGFSWWEAWGQLVGGQCPAIT